jgi:hypothetical protein
MANKTALAFCIAAAALCPASMTFAQTYEAFGPVLPMVFDGQGGRHFCLYGYYGPFEPPIAPRSDYTTLVCPYEPPRVSWLGNAQEERVSSGKARARAAK